MVDGEQHDAWSAGRSYDEYMGRWSRDVAAVFVDRLALAGGLEWVDVGCGTGALTATVLDRCDPASVLGVDPSADFVRHAASTVADDRAQFEVGSGQQLPCPDHAADAVISGLAYNFMPDRPAALAEFLRVCRPAGTVAFYVWDYPGGGVAFIDAFWKAATTIDPGVAALDEAERFQFCTADRLREEAVAAGCGDVSVEAVEVPTPFADFESFWYPFTLGAGPAPGYLASLDPDGQLALRERLRIVLGVDGPAELTARAWAARAHP